MIKEIIVVEGKTDTQKLKKIFGEDIETIETNGLSLNQSTLNLINQINQSRGIIIFTDPDGPGKKIREKIINSIDGEVLNAFIVKSDIQKQTKKIGIAEADDEAIKQALKQLVTINFKNKASITWSEYLDNNFFIKTNRIKITNQMHWSDQLSSKTLFKWLNWANLNVDDIRKMIGE
ncbi:ribonuclease M5 [Williamsoniiplasma luminosum]|uniref:Ribonuclease M5 n=1 Tax=Williamsoniiplasma luminosum TaxID=214888 RepID=A0A2K8NTK8_9MOLU|nr:ribonuclease M5 [Williamsoniiplasma luminosum]ATZ16896.1 ribonuclease M5 [Williamsoniiplasma luminosum]